LLASIKLYGFNLNLTDVRPVPVGFIVECWFRKWQLLYIYSTNMGTEYLNMLHILRFFVIIMPFVSQCYLFWFLYYSHFTYRVC